MKLSFELGFGCGFGLSVSYRLETARQECREAGCVSHCDGGSGIGRITPGLVPSTMTLPEDQSSQANFLEIASEHVHFIWNINFSNKTLSGSAIHTLTVKKDEPKELVYVVWCAHRFAKTRMG